MCLLIFIRISAATLLGRQMKSCHFTEISKAQKLKRIHVVRRVIRFFYYFAPLGFGIAEYNDRPIIEKKKQGGVSVPENGHKSRKMKSIVPDLSEKIMTCMVYWSHPVRPCVTKSCPGHNFKIIKASNFKLHTHILHIVKKCSVQEP